MDHNMTWYRDCTSKYFAGMMIVYHEDLSGHKCYSTALTTCLSHHRHSDWQEYFALLFNGIMRVMRVLFMRVNVQISQLYVYHFENQLLIYQRKFSEAKLMFSLDVVFYYSHLWPAVWSQSTAMTHLKWIPWNYNVFWKKKCNLIPQKSCGKIFSS